MWFSEPYLCAQSVFALIGCDDVATGRLPGLHPLIVRRKECGVLSLVDQCTECMSCLDNYCKLQWLILSAMPFLCVPAACSVCAWRSSNHL
jgi:hypothetical protein